MDDRNSSSSSSSTAGPDPAAASSGANCSRNAFVVTSRHAPLSDSMYDSRAGGCVTSSGRYAAPDFNTANTATTISSDRPRPTATTVSGPAPRDDNSRARRFERASSSP